MAAILCVILPFPRVIFSRFCLLSGSGRHRSVARGPLALCARLFEKK